MSEYVDAVELLRWERKVADAVQVAFREYLPRVEAAALPSLTAGLDPLPPDVGGLAATEDMWRELLRENVMPVMETLMAERVIGRAPTTEGRIGRAKRAVKGFFARLTGKAAKAYELPATREWMGAYLETVENRMVRTPDQVFRKVASEVDQGIAKGEGVRDLRERVQSVLDYSGNSDWPGRAALVARTETTAALNAATLESARLEAKALGIEYEKVWVCTIDQRTRDTHFAADGQRRALDAPFKVGAASLLFPGDPSGPVETIANCRCTIVTLEPDEELPSETDRQTERGETNSTVRNRSGTRQDEVNRRADDGVKRARDDDDGDGGVQASARGETMTRTWQGRLAPIGEVSGDARMFKEGGEFSFREFPLPLMHQRTTDEGHDSSVIVGAIRTARAEADGIYGEGVLFDSPDAMEAAALLDEGVVRPSIDWCDQKWELVDRQGAAVDPETITPDMIDDLVFQVTSMTVMAATLVSKPAFEGTSVVLGDDDEAVPDDEEQAMTEVRAALTAAGGGAPVFPASMFADPGLDRVTGIHVTGEGRVVGHVATWGECHVGIQNACVMAPRSKTGYAMFHVSEVDTDEGPLAVGRLTVGAGHADPKLGVTPAREHYDNAASCWAMGRCYEDDYGIAFSGVVHPNASSRQIMDGTSAPLSGDWRRHGGNLELVAALTVNTPGYPVVRGANDEQGRDLSLVAAGMVPASAGDTPPVEQVAAAAARAAIDEYVDRQERDRRANSIGERLSAESRDRLGRIAERRIEVDA